MQAEEAIEYLQYRAEGTCFVSVRGIVIDADPCPDRDRDQFRKEGDPVVEWWIRLTENGKPQGWILVSDRTVRVADRRF